MPAHSAHSLSHSRETELFRIHGFGLFNAGSVVFDGEKDKSVDAPDGHRDIMSIRMARDVAQRLLCYAKEDDVGIGLQRRDLLGRKGRVNGIRVAPMTHDSR